MRKVLLFLTGCMYFFAACSKDMHTNILDEGIYVAEPIVYDEDTKIDIPLPIISAGNDLVLSGEIESIMTQAVTDYLRTHKPVGMGLSVYLGGDTAWNYFYGYADQNKSVPVSENTLFHSASTGKIIMATIIFSLIQDGYLHLDNPISQWFKNEPLFDDVTIDHLLSHTSGIVTFEIIKNFQRNKRVWSEEELVKLVLDTQEQKLFQPGTAFHYSNTGYVMLGIIAQKVTGQSLDKLFDARIKEKAALHDIFYLSDFKCSDFTTARFDLNGEFIPLPDPYFASSPHGAGAFAGTPVEFAHFLHALFTENIIERSTLNLMMSNFRLCEESNQVTVYYGRGLKLIRVTVPGKENDYIGHSGQFTEFGFTSQVYHCVNQHATVCIMTNQEVVTDPLVFTLAEILPY